MRGAARVFLLTIVLAAAPACGSSNNRTSQGVLDGHALARHPGSGTLVISYPGVPVGSVFYLFDVPLVNDTSSSLTLESAHIAFASGSGRIFHITEAARWQEAQALGSFAQSTRGKSLAEVGYIHCSFEEQVVVVANFVYAGWNGDLVLLAIDPTLVAADVRVENLDGGNEEYPHVYGALPLEAVVSVIPMTRSEFGWTVTVAL
jgi:uncharacterized protein (DUF952 family)